MKNKLVLSTIRSLKNTISRFIAIFAIIAIGCGFFAGVKAAGLDMKESAWDYYNNSNLADIHILSTVGFEDEDAAIISAYENAEISEAGYTADLFIDSSEVTGKIVKAYSYDKDDKLNKLTLIEGRMPENNNECVIDYKFYSSAQPKLNEEITLYTDSDRQIEDILSANTYTVVGYVQSPIYVAFERGSTTLGNGVINGFVLIPEENFTYDVYTDITVKLKGSEKIDPFSDEYSSYIENEISELEKIVDSCVERRVQSINDEAYEEINDAKAELEDAKKEVADAQKKIDDAKLEISDAKTEIADSQQKIDEAKEKLADGENEYNDGLKSAEELKDVIAKLKSVLTDYEVNAVQNDSEVTDTVNSLNKGDTFSADDNLQQLLSGYMKIPAAFDDGTKAMAKQGIQQYISGLENELSSAQVQLEEARKELDNAKAEISDGEKKIEDGKAEIADAEKEISDGEKEIEDGKSEISDAEKKISDAEIDVAEATEDAEGFVFSRDDYYPYFSHYGEDCERIDAIAAVFPLFFILVAALVCWTTMTRMVEEQRTQIGTLKALGYSRFAIISQYILYALAASIPGAFVGLLIGFRTLPYILYVCYKSMYAQSYLLTPFRWNYAIGCIVVACLCTGLSSLYSCWKELVSRPAQLMRPKPPKNGKRILLEYITPLWKRIKFTYKVTFRNIFRYKSRVLMTVIGIAGCTALLLTGFGLRYAIASIVDRQYGGIFIYDAMAYLADDAESYGEISEKALSSGNVQESMFAMQKTYDVYNQTGETAEAYTVVPEDSTELAKYIGMKDRKNGEILQLSDDCVVINEKLSKVLNVKEGDTILVDNKYELTVGAIMENYTFNYIFLTRNTYEKAGFDAPVKNNIMYINMTDASIEEPLSEALVGCEDVLAVVYSAGGGDKFRNLVSSLSMIVVAIIVSAGALAFVVLFNLSNINVNERIHELATIKVLGFFDGEVAAYIYRENTISAMLGMAVGLILGVFLERFVVKTAEVDAVMFAQEIPFYCFVAAGAMTLMFAVIVNIYLYFRLKKIDMAASLKAIE